MYVDEPFDADEWIRKMKDAIELPEDKISFEEYQLRTIAEQYGVIFRSCVIDAK